MTKFDVQKFNELKYYDKSGIMLAVNNYINRNKKDDTDIGYNLNDDITDQTEKIQTTTTELNKDEGNSSKIEWDNIYKKTGGTLCYFIDINNLLCKTIKNISWHIKVPMNKENKNTEYATNNQEDTQKVTEDTQKPLINTSKAITLITDLKRRSKRLSLKELSKSVKT